MAIAEGNAYRNVHYKSDTEYVIKVPKILLTPIGIWPLQRGDSFRDKTITLVQITLIFCLMCFLLIPHFIATFFGDEDKRKMMKVIAAQVFSLLAVIKFWTVIVNRNKIRFCLWEMEGQYRDVKCEEDRIVMKKSARVGRLFTILYLSLSYGGALPYHIVMPLVAERIVREDNSTQIPLPYPSDYVFFQVRDSPLYEIFFVTQIFVSTVILSTNSGVYSLIASCVMHSCSLFDVVCRQMENVLKEGLAEDFSRRLINVVKNHLNAIKYAEMIEKALNIVFLCEMIGCTVIICFLEYGVLLDMEDQKTFSMMIYFILTTSIFVNIFIISYIGNRLKEQSERFGEYVYFIEWYDLPKRYAGDIILMILRSSQPSKLTAGKMFDVSLEGFSDVVKTSAAYFNFLRTVT